MKHVKLFGELLSLRRKLPCLAEISSGRAQHIELDQTRVRRRSYDAGNFMVRKMVQGGNVFVDNTNMRSATVVFSEDIFMVADIR